MTKKTIIPVRRTFGGFAADCSCGRRIFRSNRNAATKAKTEHLKLEHNERWKKGKIQ